LALIEDQSIITALGHPLRARILTELDSGESSPKELAARLDEKLGNVSYHVRILARLGLIELVRTTPRRGAVEHHYRSLPRPGAVLHLELSLDDRGWTEASAAFEELRGSLAAIAERRSGLRSGRVVGAVL
jgi:DNA-binding transcriptional ArsR family regulator